jgi:hypothetical protein
MKIIECVQGSDSWWDAKRGIPSASNIKRIVTPKKRQLSGQIDKYIDQLIGERMSLYHPERVEAFTSRSMEFGQQIEGEARDWYAMKAREEVEQVGVCITDDGRFCCSPDGIIQRRKGLELKCVEANTHVRYLRQGGIPAEHEAQCHGGLIVTGYHEWDFLSYSPGLPPLLVTIKPDKFTDDLRVALEIFWERYSKALAAIQSL